jgi:hypothetical protein
MDDGKNRARRLPLLLVLLFLREGGTAFAPAQQSGMRTTATRPPSPLFGITEWRDLPTTVGARGGVEQVDPYPCVLSADGAPIRRVPLMLVKSDEVVLQGEKKCFQFTRDDELRIFQRAVDYNHGIFGLGLVSEDHDGILERFLLMEIVDFKMDDLGIDYGIFCEAQVVGRATLDAFDTKVGAGAPADGDKEPVTAICAEYFDQQEERYGLDDAIEMASHVVHVIAELSDREEAEGRGEGHDEDDEENETRICRFRRAIRAAHESDCQGYVGSTSSPPRSETTVAKTWSWKDVNAISWAAFSSSLTPQMDETYRLHAMDMQLVTNRLQLATFWLSDVLAKAEQSNR